MAFTALSQRNAIDTAILNAEESIKLHLKVVVYVPLCCALLILSYFMLTISNRFHCASLNSEGNSF